VLSSPLRRLPEFTERFVRNRKDRVSSRFKGFTKGLKRNQGSGMSLFGRKH